MTDIRRTKLLTQPVNAARTGWRRTAWSSPRASSAGPHLHPGPVTGYVESGAIAFERDGHPATELGPGDVFFEPAGETIRRFDNLSDREPATFIAFYLVNGDQPLIQPAQ